MMGGVKIGLRPRVSALSRLKPAAQELARKKGRDQQGEGHQLPANPGEDAQGDRKPNRQVDGEKPLERKSFDMGTPVPEGQVEQKHDA
jgi:hypothetical protein